MTTSDDHAQLVYDELRRIAASYLARERANHTLQPTALVHEAYLKLADQELEALEGQAHFRALASQAMRRILVDHARGRGAAKRDGGGQVTLTGETGPGVESGIDVLELEDALKKLEGLDARQARVVELRFFGGLSIEEAAEAIGVSPRTVKGDWRVARAWLELELAGGGD